MRYSSTNWPVPGCQYYCYSNYYCTRVLLYEKMLKETKTEKTRLFCHILIIGGIPMVGERAHWDRSLTTPM